MILGTFPWRGMEIEADMISNEIVGEAVWLNDVASGSATPIAIIRSGRVHLMTFAPTDDLATIQLRAAFNAFRAEVSELAT
jgi:hypothetical protein